MVRILRILGPSESLRNEAKTVKDKPPKVKGRKGGLRLTWKMYCVHDDGYIHVDEFAECEKGIKVRATSSGMARKLAKVRNPRH